MSCIARGDMPGPGWRTIWLWTTVSTSVVRDQLADHRVADVGVDEVGALERGPRRARVEARDVLDLRVALEPARELGAEVGRDAGDQDPAATAAPLLARFAGRRRLLRQALLDRCRGAARSRGARPQRLEVVVGRRAAAVDRARAASCAPSRSSTAPCARGGVCCARRRRCARPPRAGCRGPALAGGSPASPCARRESPIRRARDPPDHLKPAAELAERVLLPGDPHRALAVAQALLEQPRDVQPRPRALGLHRHGAGRRAADGPGDRHGRPERGDRESRS